MSYNTDINIDLLREKLDYDPETGISIRYWRGSDISTGAHVHRWDAIFGAENVDPLLGAEISGS